VNEQRHPSVLLGGDQARLRRVAAAVDVEVLPQHVEVLGLEVLAELRPGALDRVVVGEAVLDVVDAVVDRRAVVARVDRAELAGLGHRGLALLPAADVSAHAVGHLARAFREGDEVADADAVVGKFHFQSHETAMLGRNALHSGAAMC
jgi:hypothetical protein